MMHYSEQLVRCVMCAKRGLAMDKVGLGWWAEDAECRDVTRFSFTDSWAATLWTLFEAVCFVSKVSHSNWLPHAHQIGNKNEEAAQTKQKKMMIKLYQFSFPFYFKAVKWNQYISTDKI